jgi:hypothetical protein
MSHKWQLSAGGGAREGVLRCNIARGRQATHGMPGTRFASSETKTLTVDIAGMSEVDLFVELRARAREKVAHHELPAPDQLNGHGGAGSGEKCCVCELEIPKYRVEKPSIEYAVQWHKAERLEVLRFHSDCFRAWVSLSALPLPATEAAESNRDA